MPDLDCLFATYQTAQRYRDDDAHVAIARTFPKASGHHASDGLDGNLGALLFTAADGEQLGKNWIAPSKSLRSTVLEQTPHTGDLLLHYCKDHRIAMVAGDSTKYLPVRFKPGAGHANDSECVLLNTLADKLVAGVSRGEAWLLTERLPCASCTAIIIAFLTTYPDIALHVVYLADYVNAHASRSHVDFYSELSAAAVEAQLYKLDILDADGPRRTMITLIPPGTPLMGYSTKHIYAGAPRFAGVVDGKRVMTTWTEDDVQDLRTTLMVAPSSSGPRAGSANADAGAGDDDPA